MQSFYELRRDEYPAVSVWYANDNRYIAHFHSSIELIFVEEGQLIAMQDGGTYTVAAGQLIVNSCYVLHSYDTQTYNRIIICTIPLNAVPSLKTVLSRSRFSRGIVDTAFIPECHALLKMMAQHSQSGNNHFVQSLAEALLALLIEKVGLTESVNDAQSDLIRSIIHYMQQNASGPLTVSEAASQFGYSVSRFTHLFSERIGCSFTHYLATLRCRMALPLLEAGEMTLSEVADACGFGSLRTFHRVYHQITGNTPRMGGTTKL